jgi:hypothetical protein
MMGMLSVISAWFIFESFRSLKFQVRAARGIQAGHQREEVLDEGQVDH